MSCAAEQAGAILLFSDRRERVRQVAGQAGGGDRAVSLSPRRGRQNHLVNIGAGLDWSDANPRDEVALLLSGGGDFEMLATA
jgi:hypothetical protein